MKHLRNVLALVLAALVALVAATPAWALDTVEVRRVAAGVWIFWFRLVGWWVC